MSRGLLGDEGLAEVARELPDLEPLRQAVFSVSPGFTPIKFPTDSFIPVAAVCFQDASHTVHDANYAFHEVLAHRKWYLEKRDPPNEDAATSFSRYYLDDLALRLYSAGEHLANAITFMLEIKKPELDPYRKNKRISKQVVVGKFLLKEKTGHPITEAVRRLVESNEWLRTLQYRNDWVHNQPPPVEGFGIVYERQRRWKVDSAGAMLTFGGGDKPKFSITDLLDFMRPSLFLFVEVLTAVAQYYKEMVEGKGDLHV
jgi:hypothetical protein